MGFRFKLEAKGLARAFEDDLAVDITNDVQASTETAKKAIRSATRQAFKGQKLPNAWRSQVFPRGRPSVDAAGWVHVNSASAADVIESALEARVLRNRTGRWLAIPLAAAGRNGKGRGEDGRFRSTRMTPAAFEAETGIKLRFVLEAGGRRAFLVADNYLRRPGSRRARQAPSTKPIVVFVLVRQVTTRKRLDLDAIAENAAANLAAGITSKWG